MSVQPDLHREAQPLAALGHLRRHRDRGDIAFDGSIGKRDREDSRALLRLDVRDIRLVDVDLGEHRVGVRDRHEVRARNVRGARDRRLADLDVERRDRAVDRRVDTRLAQVVFRLGELSRELRERRAARLEIDACDVEVLARNLELVVVDELALVQPTRALPLRLQVLDLQFLALDRDLLDALRGLVLLDGGAQPLVVDLQHELPLLHAIAFLDEDGRDTADLLGRELGLLLVDEPPGREHGRLDAARRDLLRLHFDGDAAADSRLDERNRDHEDHDADDDDEPLVHRFSRAARVRCRSRRSVRSVRARSPPTSRTTSS